MCITNWLPTDYSFLNKLSYYLFLYKIDIHMQFNIVLLLCYFPEKQHQQYLIKNKLDLVKNKIKFIKPKINSNHCKIDL